MTRLYVHPLPIRLWHWFNAAGFIAMILTGLQIRYRVFDALPLATVVDVHNKIGFALIANYGVWLVYYLFSNQITVYLPELSPRKQYQRMFEQIAYYGYGLFKGQPNPHHVSVYRKFNALQAVTYQIVMILLVPLMYYTGLVLWDMARFAGTVDLLGGPRVVSALHVLLFVGFVAFLFVHVYLTTLGHSALAHIRAMFTGYEDVDDAPDAAKSEAPVAGTSKP